MHAPEEAKPTLQTASDEQIVARVQRGESRLFTLIFDRHYARLERFLRHLHVPEDDLEDVLAETFTRAYARVHLFNPESGSRYVSYLYAIARNLATDRVRERGRMPATTLLEEAWGEADDAVAPVEALLQQEDLARIRRAMRRMSASDREIITLSYDRELSCREIMQIMGKPSITAVTTHLYKAMKRLRELVHQDEPALGTRR